MRQPGPLVASAVIALLSLIWGTTWAAIRISLEGFPPLTGVALRFAVASAVLVVVARALGASGPSGSPTAGCPSASPTGSSSGPSSGCPRGWPR
ncbi:MAG: hypothetical protein MUC56_18940 [Thermoanaerobaculales bacterium]|nr:hypothetical protein [Thermoanaerobaculales bacterium]